MRNFSKLNSLLKSANALKALQMDVLLYNPMTASASFFKVLAEFNEIFNFEKFLIYVLPKI